MSKLTALASTWSLLKHPKVCKLCLNESFEGNLVRPKQPIPSFVTAALKESGLMTDYKNRPAYQRNDYIGWVISVKRPQTAQKRLNQMLDELRAGGVYMRMDHPPSRKQTKSGLSEQQVFGQKHA